MTPNEKYDYHAQLTQAEICAENEAGAARLGQYDYIDLLLMFEFREIVTRLCRAARAVIWYHTGY